MSFSSDTTSIKHSGIQVFRINDKKENDNEKKQTKENKNVNTNRGAIRDIARKGAIKVHLKRREKKRQNQPIRTQ